MPPKRVLRALYIVYDADGTRAGELMYMLRKTLGIAHCAACDITHGPRVEKPEFTALKAAGWSVPMHNIHRDEMAPALAAAVGDALPVVAAATEDGGHVMLMTPRQLDDCEGLVPVLERSINAALAGAGLFVPPFAPTRRRAEPPGFGGGGGVGKQHGVDGAEEEGLLGVGGGEDGGEEDEVVESDEEEEVAEEVHKSRLRLGGGGMKAFTHGGHGAGMHEAYRDELPFKGDDFFGTGYDYSSWDDEDAVVPTWTG